MLTQATSPFRRRQSNIIIATCTTLFRSGLMTSKIQPAATGLQAENAIAVEIAGQSNFMNEHYLRPPCALARFQTKLGKRAERKSRNFAMRTNAAITATPLLPGCWNGKLQPFSTGRAPQQAPAILTISDEQPASECACEKSRECAERPTLKLCHAWHFLSPTNPSHPQQTARWSSLASRNFPCWKNDSHSPPS
ncbi:hypothetical protein ZHAS_00012521 [Anopheles sinensis]|uniref:Uncharacterized protein n=1 Tax=Anopheles sinensis TaxID=74873 RepID=A0A084W342_ANOSI|nr:hypothetical protein ZHAS_00012521 [Anopheles sinensis]